MHFTLSNKVIIKDLFKEGSRIPGLMSGFSMDHIELLLCRIIVENARSGSE